MGSTQSAESGDGSRALLRHPRLLDAGTLLGIWVFVSFLSTAQRWTWLNTPDAEFYASLGLFGSEVTDRTVSPAYYWTRLGAIAPVRALTEVLGSWSGYHAYWLLLLAILVTALFVTVRRFTTRTVAAFVTLVVALNTVVLTFVGSPYVTGTAITAMSVVIAGTVWQLPRRRSPDGSTGERSRIWAPLVTGLAFGWLAMTNPNGLFMTAAMWLVGTVIATIHLAGRRLRHVLATTALVIVGAAASFLLLLLASHLIFPGLDWVQTTLYWSQALDLSGYVGDPWAFLRDVSMIVPLCGMIGVLIALAFRLRDPIMQVAASLSPVAFGVTLLIVIARPNGTLEVGHYQSMQWPPVLWGIALTVAAFVGQRTTSRWILLPAALSVVLTIVAGHWAGTMTVSTGWVIALALMAAFLASLLWLARADADARSAGRAVIVVVCCTGLLMAGFQLLQNARRPTGVMAEGVYSSAYNASDAFARLSSARDAEAWLIANTTRDDTVMVWVDADWANQEQTLLSMAAFQIWGINQVTPERTMEGVGVGNATAARPTVLAMYGKSKDAIIQFWSSIPREIPHTDPVCSDYPWPDPAVPRAYLCLTRLTWP